MTYHKDWPHRRSAVTLERTEAEQIREALERGRDSWDGGRLRGAQPYLNALKALAVLERRLADKDEALRFYGHAGNYHSQHSDDAFAFPVNQDGGKIARETLRSEEQA